MHQLTQTRQFNAAYAAACVFALFAGFTAGIALIPDGLLQSDRIDARTIKTHFFHSRSVDKTLMGTGWMPAGSDGTWSRGRKSEMQISVDRNLAKSLELEFVLFPYLAKQHKKQAVRITVNGHEVGRWKFKAPMRRNLRSVDVNKTIWRLHDPVQIGFEYANPKSPAELGMGGSQEQLAIRLSSLVVRKQR